MALTHQHVRSFGAITISSAILTACTSPAGQAAALTHPTAAHLLPMNPHLSADNWQQLWDTRTDPADNLRMLAYQTPAACLDHVCARERRHVVLRELVNSQDLTEQQARLVLARLRRNAGHIRHWLTGRRYPAAIEADLLDLIPAADRPHYQSRSPHQFDQGAFTALLDGATTPEGAAKIARNILTNPNAGDPALLARAHHLVTAHLDARLLSPNDVSQIDGRLRDRNYGLTRPWDQARTPKELDLLGELVGLNRLPWPTLRRTLARTGGPAARFGIVDVTAERMYGRIYGTVPGGHLPLDTPLSEAIDEAQARAVAHEITDQLDRIGPDAWTTAMTLLVDGYTGTGDDLIATCAALGRDTGRPVAVPPAPRTRRSTARSRS